MDVRKKISLLAALLLSLCTVMSAAAGSSAAIEGEKSIYSPRRWVMPERPERLERPEGLESLEGQNNLEDLDEETRQEALANLEKHETLTQESGLSTQTQAVVTITVYNHTVGETMWMDLEEYLQGVVLAEMPLSYGIEALKAQAVAARTVVYYQQMTGKRHAGGAAVCTDYRCCQAWKSAADAGGSYPEKVQQAVLETRNVIATYEGNPINAMYFSSSGGYTENIADVWGGEPCAYLQSVSSMNESAFGVSEEVRVVEMSPWIMLVRLRDSGIEPSCASTALLKSITDVVRSETGRVKTLTIGGAKTTGTAVRTALGLRSTNFYFKSLSDGRIAIITIGYGHGVGMSQCGAGAMAAEGYSYGDILRHYYTGVTVEWWSGWV